MKGKDIVPKRKRNQDLAHVCTMCDEYIAKHNKWVGCDYCDKWMCKNCAGLDTDDLMNNAKSSKWKCPLCLEKKLLCASICNELFYRMYGYHLLYT